MALKVRRLHVKISQSWRQVAVGHVIVGMFCSLAREREKPLQLNSAQLAPNW